MGNLAGKSVLDVGCGYGGNAVLLAKLGAKVTGIDISPTSIELARKCAQVNGVADSVEFVCAPLESAQLQGRTFDVIWGDNVLHHLIEDLEASLAALTPLVRPGGILVFSEPVNLNHALRRIRFMLPVHTDVTPDERPLESQEIAILRKQLPQLRLRYFDLFGRLGRFVLQSHNYERSSPFRRFLWNVITSGDCVVHRIPGLKNLAGQAVLWGPASK